MNKLIVLTNSYVDNGDNTENYLFCDKNMASFDCQIMDDKDNIVASGVLNAFRPDDIKDFMENKNE